MMSKSFANLWEHRTPGNACVGARNRSVNTKLHVPSGRRKVETALLRLVLLRIERR